VTGARLATTHDAEAIARIYCAAADHRTARSEDYNEGIADRLATFETEPGATDDIARGLKEPADRWPTVVVERDGRVIAWASASEYRTRACYSGVAELRVYVTRDERGTGAGRVAMDALVRECEGRRIWKLLSRVFPENGASRRRLAKVGFREVGTYGRHAKLDGEWRDTVIVERLIGEAALP
jgi:phosphinothricin acetyltransferase